MLSNSDSSSDNSNYNEDRHPHIVFGIDVTSDELTRDEVNKIIIDGDYSDVKELLKNNSSSLNNILYSNWFLFDDVHRGYDCNSMAIKKAKLIMDDGRVNIGKQLRILIACGHNAITKMILETCSNMIAVSLHVDAVLAAHMHGNQVIFEYGISKLIEHSWHFIDRDSEILNDVFYSYDNLKYVLDKFEIEPWTINEFNNFIDNMKDKTNRYYKRDISANIELLREHVLAT